MWSSGSEPPYLLLCYCSLYTELYLCWYPCSAGLLPLPPKSENVSEKADDPRKNGCTGASAKHAFLLGHSGKAFPPLVPNFSGVNWGRLYPRSAPWLQNWGLQSCLGKVILGRLRRVNFWGSAGTFMLTWKQYFFCTSRCCRHRKQSWKQENTRGYDPLLQWVLLLRCLSSEFSVDQHGFRWATGVAEK